MKILTFVNILMKRYTSKWDKAKWLWVLSNGSLVIPIILALIVLYFTYEKIDTIFKMQQEHYREIKIEDDKLIKNYQELIGFQKSTYKEIIEEIKKDKLH